MVARPWGAPRPASVEEGAGLPCRRLSRRHSVGGIQDSTTAFEMLPAWSLWHLNKPELGQKPTEQAVGHGAAVRPGGGLAAGCQTELGTAKPVSLSSCCPGALREGSEEGLPHGPPAHSPLRCPAAGYCPMLLVYFLFIYCRGRRRRENEFPYAATLPKGPQQPATQSRSPSWTAGTQRRESSLPPPGLFSSSRAGN